MNCSDEYKRHTIKGGYVMVRNPSHPLATKFGLVLEHRMVMYDAGLLTDTSMQVHHINGDRQDNRVENLIALSASEHQKIKQRPRKGAVQCLWCDEMTTSRYKLCALHRRQAYYRNRDILFNHPELLDTIRTRHAKT